MARTFADDVATFRRALAARLAELHQACATRVFDSIVEGSELTGAPGQPVDTGNLRNSWQRIPVSRDVTEIVTNTVYAPDIEDGVRRGEVVGVGADDATDGIKAPDTTLTLRSEVGGFHSVKLTRAAWARIVEDATGEVAGAG
jgi:hypothetical protein